MKDIIDKLPFLYNSNILFFNKSSFGSSMKKKLIIIPAKIIFNPIH